MSNRKGRSCRLGEPKGIDGIVFKRGDREAGLGDGRLKTRDDQRAQRAAEGRDLAAHRTGGVDVEGEIGAVDVGLREAERGRLGGGQDRQHEKQAGDEARAVARVGGHGDLDGVDQAVTVAVRL